MLLGHRLSALLQLHLHSQLNTWLQWTGQRQLQDETRNIYVLGFVAAYIRELTAIFCRVFSGFASGCSSGVQSRSLEIAILCGGPCFCSHILNCLWSVHFEWCNHSMCSHICFKVPWHTCITIQRWISLLFRSYFTGVMFVIYLQTKRIVGMQTWEMPGMWYRISLPCAGNGIYRMHYTSSIPAKDLNYTEYFCLFVCERLKDRDVDSAL